jgi:hypothetical protein
MFKNDQVIIPYFPNNFFTGELDFTNKKDLFHVCLEMAVDVYTHGNMDCVGKVLDINFESNTANIFCPVCNNKFNYIF